MKRILAPTLSLCLPLLAPSSAFAAAFERPIPQPQTETAEFWFLVGSIALIISLGFVQYLVSRR
ncbi:hypothetical protein J4729_19795 [Leisingera sp. HS039]|uniref:hypothetical protein n=1 Tax=unclassified Leisingera TaxID=2614906 RepID=UPI001070A7ED|nr:MULTISPECIES: hypothetical protein [unclassified Leisingera]MBQ4826767.1 hypothetical protein [Leisingera sp. HS039]MCF6432725.1 hypothetical protein [Leisingera sp. MMG026]QBR35444.1 hypothetical protein ETW23_04090 [Leisingera sp. NJS201]